MCNNGHEIEESKRPIVKFFILSIVILLTQQVHAAFVLPKNLNASDRLRATEILALGTAPKILGNPYPLGGYSGIEFGLSAEFIPTEDLAELGGKSPNKDSFSYNTLMLGKGIHHNVDTFVYFTPLRQESGIQTYGAQLRWGFYESSYFPFALSMSLYAGGANFANLVNASSFGGDLLATVSVDRVAAYIGIGQVRGSAQFIGGSNGITAEGVTVEHSIMKTHSLLGMSFSLSRFFAAVEINRYEDSFYGAKLGYRF